MVVVVQIDELAQLLMTRQRSGLGRDPFLQVAVGADHVHEVVDQVVAGPVEFGRETPLSDGHPDAVGEPLAEWAGRGLDSLSVSVLGVTGRQRAPLSEGLQILDCQPVSGQVKQRVEEHAGVARGEQESIAIGPPGIGGRVAQETRPEGIGHRCHAHRRARMTGVGLLDCVDR